MSDIIIKIPKEDLEGNANNIIKGLAAVAPKQVVGIALLIDTATGRVACASNCASRDQVLQVLKDFVRKSDKPFQIVEPARV